MDTGAQQVAPDTGVPASGARTAEDVSAGDMSASIEKGKAPEVPEVRTDPAPVSIGQATPAAPDATNVSIFLIYPQSPKMLAVGDMDISDFQIFFST
jgi:hypothetical protein